MSYLLWTIPFIYPGLLIIILHSYQVTYGTPLDPGTHLCCHIFLAFYTVHEILTSSVLQWFVIPSARGSHFVELSAMACPSWVALHGMAHSFGEVWKPLGREKAVSYKGGIQFISVAQLSLTLWDPVNCRTPGLPVHFRLPEFTETHANWVGDAIQLYGISLCCPIPLLPSIFPSIGVFFQMSQLFASGGQSIGA